MVQCENMDTSSQELFRIYNASSIGAAIRHYRKGEGLTQAELAERAGVSRYYISQLERGLETEQLRRTLVVLRQLGVRATLQRADW